MTLTDLQKNYLLKRSEADSSTRSRYDFKLVQKLRGVLDDVRNAYWILKFMPRQSVQKVITDDQIFSLLEVSTMLMRRMDYKKIRSIDDETLIVFREDKEGRLQSVSPSEIDLQRAKKLYEHLYELERFIGIRLFDRVPIPGYERPLHDPGGLEDALEHQLRDRFQEAKAQKEVHPK
jgi:hypothetical protein